MILDFNFWRWGRKRQVVSTRTRMGSQRHGVSYRLESQALALLLWGHAFVRAWGHTRMHTQGVTHTYAHVWGQSTYGVKARIAKHV